MRNLLLAASAAATLIAAAPLANAAIILNFTFAPDGNSAVASFDSHGAGANFSDTYTFVLPAGFGSTALTTAAENGVTDTAFTSVLLNGDVLTTNSSGVIDERSLLHVPLNPGANSLVVSGTSGGLYSYGGNIAFAKLDITAVPEPASWVLMIMGFGGLGAALRSRRQRTLIAARPALLG